jgi:5-methylcytosine-specific restriction endonuclease McrA
METTSAQELSLRLAEMVRRERHLVVAFVVELADFAGRELYRELGYDSLFYYCVRQLGLPKSSSFRRSEAARLVARFPVIAGHLRDGSLSIRSLVELREVLTEQNHAEVVGRAAGMSQEEARLLAVEYNPRPVPCDVIRRLPEVPVSAETAHLVPAGTDATPRNSDARPRVPAGPPEYVELLTRQLRRLNVTVSADFMMELEQARAALSHQIPDGDFERVVREGFKLILERQRKRKALTERGHAQSAHQPKGRHIPAAVRRQVWKRDGGRCTWEMGDGKPCGSTHRLEFDHGREFSLGGESTVDNVRLLCRKHNVMKAEERFGREFMGRFRAHGRSASKRVAPEQPP